MTQLAHRRDNVKTRIFLIDDNSDFLKAAADFVRWHPGLQLVGATADGAQALTQASHRNPQVILIDLELPDLVAQRTIPLLRELLPDVGIVALTLLDSDAYLTAAHEAGAQAIVSKSKLVSDLLPAIRRLTEADEPPRDTQWRANEAAGLHLLPENTPPA